MLVTENEVLLKARKEGYGVIAPSAFCLDHIRVAVEAAEEMNSPIIININGKLPFVAQDKDLDLLAQAAKEYARRASVPVVINLDHGPSYEMVVRAISYGFTSVMIDKSVKPFEENVAETLRVVQTAHARNIPVEAELGCVGMGDASFKVAGHATESTLTDPALVKEFVERTGVDFLAICIGNAHGPYAKGMTPHIDFERLSEIANVTDIPLVLHGGSGTGDENLSKACKMGISKINVGTDLVKEGISRAIAAVKENSAMGGLHFLDNYNGGYKDKIKYYMEVFGSVNKA